MLEQLSLLDLVPEPEPELPTRYIPPAHTCHVPGCDILISPSLLMCIRHWVQVPKPLQQEVWRHYRSGQEEDKQPSAQYLTAARAAIQAVTPALPPKPEQPAAPKTWFLIGDRVFIAQQTRGCSKPNPEDKKNPIPVWFTPWNGCPGTFCGLNSAGLALLDFGVPGLLYPVPLDKLSL